MDESPQVVSADEDETRDTLPDMPQETRALLGILALGKRQVAQGKTSSIADAVASLRARHRS